MSAYIFMGILFAFVLGSFFKSLNQKKRSFVSTFRLVCWVVLLAGNIFLLTVRIEKIPTVKKHVLKYYSLGVWHDITN